MAEQAESTRLTQAKNKLERLNNELNEQVRKVLANQQLTNGQPMNDKRNGRSWANKQERLEDKARTLKKEITKQEEYIDRLYQQEELKQQGLNKYGGLDMTVENIPKIREELERFKNGQSRFSEKTIKKYEKRLVELEHLKKVSESGKANISPETQAVIDSGKITQWKRNPTIYFVKGYRKVALELNETGTLESSVRYPATSEEEKAAVQELLDAANPSVFPMRKSPEHFYRVEFNENDRQHGPRSYAGEIVTLELLDQLKILDDSYLAKLGYYKFYFEEVKDGEVVDQLRMDIGDGVESNQEIYSKLAELCEKKPDKEKEHTLKEETLRPEKQEANKNTKNQNTYTKRDTEDIRKEVKALSQQAIDAVKKHTRTADDVKEFLNFMSHLPERPFRNQILIEQQFPGARACLGRAALKKEGIYIRKGEIGNKIFVRKTVKGFFDEKRGFVREKEASAEDKRKIASGEIKLEKKPYFTIEKVFDITQTQLKPEDYPKIFPNRVFDFKLDEKGKSELAAGIQALAKELDISIRDMKDSELHSPELGTVRGAYVQNTLTGKDEIVLNSRNTETQNLATSIHELAHRKMHKFSSLDRPTKELQAEMTSYIVSKHFGMDTSEKAIPYIASWTKNGEILDDKQAIERGKIFNDISMVANQFIRTISTEINHQRELELEKNNEKIVELANSEPKGILDNSSQIEQNAGPLWIDTKNGTVLQENTGRTLTLSDAAYVQHSEKEMVLKGKLYGIEVTSSLGTKEFFDGKQFSFPKETVEAGQRRKNEIYQSLEKHKSLERL